MLGSSGPNAWTGTWERGASLKNSLHHSATQPPVSTQLGSRHLGLSHLISHLIDTVILLTLSLLQIVTLYLFTFAVIRVICAKFNSLQIVTL